MQKKKSSGKNENAQIAEGIDIEKTKNFESELK